MAETDDVSRLDCAVNATMSVIEGRWKATILCKLIMKGTFRFNQLMKEMKGISPRMLTKQLREMEKDGLVTRAVFPEVPPRVEYSITPRGATLGPILTAMAQWSLSNMFPRKIVKIDERVTAFHKDPAKACSTRP